MDLMPQRIQLSRRKGWRKPEGAIVVARPSRWGNPFPVERFGRDLAIALFRETVQGGWTPRLLQDFGQDVLESAYLDRTAWINRLGGHPTELVRRELAGHDLACWCRLDQLCHADVLLEIANG